MARNLQVLTNGLRSYLPSGSAITQVVPLSTGHSNETYLLEGINRILRMPPSEEGLLPPYDMAREHATLAAVGSWKDGPPVPRVYELCLDSDVIGDAFFVMEYLTGEAFEYTVPTWLQDAPDATRHAMSTQWFDAITSLHNMPVERMPGRVSTVLQEAQHWADIARTAEAPVSLLEILDDLVARPPASSGSPTPVHGDSKNGNCLWNGPKLVAMLDWEMAHVGEPLTDLGYMTQFYGQGQAALASAGMDLPGWKSRTQLIAHWEEKTGRTAHDLVRYEVLAMAKISAIIALGYHLFRVGRAKDARFELWGAVLPKYLQLALQRANESVL